MSMTSAQEAHRLKDTCDMCSASKVRCDTRKPVCSRCQRLGYPCFYSPARRIRKRKCSSEGTVDNDSGKKTDARQNLQTICTGYPSHESRLAPAGNFDGNETFNFRNLEALSSSNLNRFTSGIPFAGNQAGTRHEDLFSVVDLEVNGGGRVHPSNLATSTTASGLPSTSHKHGSSNASMDSARSEYEPHKVSTPNDDFDCATVALGILQRLNTPTAKRISPPSSSISIETAFPSSSSASNSADIRMQTVAVAIKRASTVLICPCSRRADVGLLVATICIALLDALELMLQGTVRTQPDQSSRPKRSTLRHSSMSTIIRDLPTALEFRTRNLKDDSDVSASTMYILEQLPQVASLVIQFITRYEQDTQRGGSDLLKALGASVIYRLRGMIDEVTDRVAQLG
ncbi:hypothetical protein MMC11_004454 [Xylographa trunciseda]|nr:hypothetical protein [Xylographa trunciseda]